MRGSTSRVVDVQKQGDALRTKSELYGREAFRHLHAAALSKVLLSSSDIPMGPNCSISIVCATSNFCILIAANRIIKGEAISTFVFMAIKMFMVFQPEMVDPLTALLYLF
ncbi:hypothetical protein Tco_1049725 [Tanacetum coccineum]